MALTLDELRWFLVVAETENVSRAAERLCVSQPALSRAIRRMERRYDTQLFDRVRQRLRLSASGEALRIRVEASLRELDTAEDDIAQLKGPQPGIVSLSFLHSLGTWLVPDLMGKFTQKNPDTRFMLYQDSADKVVAMLVAGQVDLALTGPRPSDPLVVWEPLRTEPLALAVWEKHPLAERSSIWLKEVLHHRFITMQSEFGLRQTTETLFHRRGVEPDVVLESAEIATIRALVANELGIAILPSGPQHAPLVPGIVLVPLEDEDAYRTLGLAWFTNRVLPNAARRFRAFALEWEKDARSPHI